MDSAFLKLCIFTHSLIEKGKYGKRLKVGRKRGKVWEEIEGGWKEMERMGRDGR